MAYRIPPVGQPISLLDVQIEFGGEFPIPITEYYGVDDGVPVSGQISLNDFYGTEGEFIWCNKPMTNVIVGASDQIETQFSYEGSHGSNTILLKNSMTRDSFAVCIIQDDGTSILTIGDNSLPNLQSFAPISETEGYAYDIDETSTGANVSKYSIDPDDPAVLILGSSETVKTPDTGGQSAYRNIFKSSFDESTKRTGILMTAKPGDVPELYMRVTTYLDGIYDSEYGDTKMVDFYEGDSYPNVISDDLGNVIVFGKKNIIYLTVDPVDHDIAVVFEREYTTTSHSYYACTMSTINGRLMVVFSYENDGMLTVELIDLTIGLDPVYTVDLDSTVIWRRSTNPFLNGECLVIGGWETDGRPSKMKLIKATVTNTDISVFTTLYLSPEITEAEDQFNMQDGIYRYGNKWAFSAQDSDYKMRVLSLTVL